MDKKASWDDIPSLDLSIEIDAEMEVTKEHRTAVRMVSKDILRMLTENARVMYVRVATDRGALKQMGVLEDINKCGLCFSMSGHHLQKNESIKIGVMLGKRPLQTNANVRWVTGNKVGVEYVNPKPEDVHFLAELYTAKILNRV
jgi:hypothetical protein